MTIVLAVAGYFAVVGIFVRFAQFMHGRDEEMQVMTSGWIHTRTGSAE